MSDVGHLLLICLLVNSAPQSKVLYLVEQRKRPIMVRFVSQLLLEDEEKHQASV